MDSNARAWAHGVPAFIEIFDGQGGLSVAIAAGGWPVCPGVDRCRSTYGAPWHLDRESDRCRSRYLLFEVVRPGGVHCALPCDPWSPLGKHSPDASAFELARFVIHLLGNVQRAGGVAYFERPRVHGLVKHAQWQAEFGTPSDAKAPWEYAFPDCCMYGCRSPGAGPLAINNP